MDIKVNQVNAFTANSLGGNPAGVVLSDDELTEAQMLEVAKRAGFSETAFVMRDDLATRRLRFFTPTDEVDLCGHATIASWSYLYNQKILPIGNYTQMTKAGLLKVEICDNGLIYMEQARQEFFEVISAEEVATALGIRCFDLYPGLEARIVSTGLRDILVPVVNEDILSKLKPNFRAISEISSRYGVVGMHVFTPLSGQQSIASSRNFAPLFGINEESATGTSNGALLCYLREYKRLTPQGEYRIEQGRAMGDLSYIYGKFIEGAVWVGGEATIIKNISMPISV